MGGARRNVRGRDGKVPSRLHPNFTFHATERWQEVRCDTQGFGLSRPKYVLPTAAWVARD